MTAHTTDADGLRRIAEAADRWGVGMSLHPGTVLAMLDRATRAEAQSETRRLDIEYWQERAGGFEARIQVVREIHTPFEDKDCGTVCAECSYFGGDYGLYPADYPCDTIRALEG